MFLLAFGTFPSVVSAVIVPHRSQSSPACLTLATGASAMIDIEASGPDWAPAGEGSSECRSE